MLRKNRWLCLFLSLLLLAPPLTLPGRAESDTYAENEQQIFQFLTGTMHLSVAAACGVLGNIRCESGCDPTARCLDVNNKISFGLCQWNGGRFEALKSYCAGQGLDYESVDGQLQYMYYELQNSEKTAWQKLQGLPDTAQGAYAAGYNWARYFERCYSSYFPLRAQTACDPYWLRYGGSGEGKLLFFQSGNGSCSETVRVLGADGAFGALPTPAWPGFTFLGWYTAPGGGRSVESGAVSGSSMVLYARWDSAERFVRRLYSLCLGREADSGGLRSWTGALESGALSAAEAAAGFFASAEYRSRSRSDTEFVSALYAALLDRAADAGGLSNWLGHLQSGRSRCWVFSRFCQCGEFLALCSTYGLTAGKVGESAYDMGGGVDRDKAGAFVDRLYALCLGRGADAAGRSFWLSRLVGDGWSGGRVAAGFLFSEECSRKGYGDSAYVELLYRTLLDRGVDASGQATWSACLRSGQSRRWVFERICASAEFSALCAAYGIAAGA